MTIRNGILICAVLWGSMSFCTQQIQAQAVLVPGSGFLGPTAQPPTVGPGLPGSNAKAIAHWDIVPFQTFTGNLNIGVVAFHRNGIDRVEFSAKGGPWTPATTMTLNPQTSVTEYWVTLRATDLADGPVEVRAIAYPKTAGVPRVVSYNYQVNGGPEVFGCQLYANANNTMPAQVRCVSPSGSNSNNGLTPSTAYATILHAAQQIQSAQGGDAGGGTIYLMPNQNWAVPSLSGISAANRWLTISGAPGTTADQVVFASGAYNGLPGGLLKIKNLRLQGPNMEIGGQGGGIWFEGVKSMGTDPYNDTGGTSSVTTNKPKGIYVTESYYEYLTVPLVRQHLTRNVELLEIGDDLFHTPRCVINVTSHDHGKVNTAFHSDFVGWADSLQGIFSTENYIFYNVKSYDCGDIQGIYDDDYGGGWTRNCVAFINVLIDRIAPSAGNGQWSGSINTNHFLLWHVTHDTISFKLNTPNVTNLSVKGCSWDGITAGSQYNSSFDNNHFASGSSYGTNATTGDAKFANEAANDYSPALDSPLRNRISSLLVNTDADGMPRQTPADVGAFEESGGVTGDCSGDVNANGAVDVDDLLSVINEWGSCAGCDSDIAPKDGDGIVDVDDLLAIINDWGICE
jgi:hypothetical protein